MRYCGSTASQSYQSSSAIPGQMRFRRLDMNNDGMISRNEWRGNVRAFQTRDWNGDGVLSGDEVRVNAMPPAGKDEYQDLNAANQDRLEYLDVNGNNMVEENEWDGSLDAFNRMDRNQDRLLSGTELSRLQSSAFASLDTNRDGRISLNEWPGSHRAFDQQDTNGDGTLSRAEYRSGAVATSGR